MNPPSDLLARAERLLGSKPVSWTQATGGYSAAERWRLVLDDDRRVFTKLAPTDELASMIRQEHANMSAFEADFRCDVIAWEDGDRPLLVLEDLGDAHWPPPWEPGQVDRVIAMLERLWATQPPEHLPSAAAATPTGWGWVYADPEKFLSLGIASRDWLDACVEILAAAAASAPLEGDDFLHLDVRSDNMCFTSDRVVLVDWNWASRGHRDLDLACWLPSLRLEGGPLPEEVRGGLGSYAAGMSGFFASQASLPPPEGAPSVRRFQLRQLRISLPWACRELGLPQPDVQYARHEIAEIDRAFDEGQIDEERWHARTEEVLIDAYLASDDPRAQSGKGGDEDDWRWARALILDVFPARATFLDIGCANGYLMESVHRWGSERGIDVEPYGLDISPRIAALAKHRLPQWSDRIFVGNAIDWDPPMRFDIVQAGIDEVPPPRQRDLIDRIRSRFLAPGGKLVFRAERVRGTEPSVVDKLHTIGLEPDGTIESTHPRNGELRRTAWLNAPVG